MKQYGVTIAGLALLGIGLFFLKTVPEPHGIFKALPYLFVGLGCGLFGHGAGNLLSRRAVAKHPEIQKQIEIDTNDERNMAIANRAKSKAYDLMVFLFGALMLSYAIMGVELAAVLLLVVSYLFVIFYGVYYRLKFEREM